MKTYKVKLLTTQGVKEVIVKENEVHKIEQEILSLYGTFTTLSSEEILTPEKEKYEMLAESAIYSRGFPELLNKESQYFQQSFLNYCEFQAYELITKIIKKKSKFNLI